MMREFARNNKKGSNPGEQADNDAIPVLVIDGVRESLEADRKWTIRTIAVIPATNPRWYSFENAAPPVGYPFQYEVVAGLAALEKPLRQRGLTSLALFGSVVRSTARADSDIDVLVDVASDAQFSLIDLVAVKDFLEDQLGRRVDVVTSGGLEDPAIYVRHSGHRRHQMIDETLLGQQLSSPH